MHLGRKLLSSVIALASLGAFISLGSFFSQHHLLFDLISHFRVQYIVLLLPMFLLAIYAKKTLPVLIISLALAVHGYVVTMSLLPVSPQNDTEYAELTVLNSNLLLVNTNYQAQLDIITFEDPDLIAFQEYTHNWHAELSASLTNYPHRITEPAGGSFGIALYSKYPVSGGIQIFGDKSFPAIKANIDIGAIKLQAMVVHPPPPSIERLYIDRNQIMQKVASEAKAIDSAVLVMGDFNSTPWSAHFSNMTSVGKLRNASAGHGFHPTWPTSVFALSIPIDHILVNAKIGVDHFKSLVLGGSDHRNIVSRLRVY